MKKAEEPPKPVRPCKSCRGWHRAVEPGWGNPIAGKTLQAMPPPSLPAILCPQRKPQKQKGSAKPLQLPPHTLNSLPRPPEPPLAPQGAAEPRVREPSPFPSLPKALPGPPQAASTPPNPTGSPPGTTSTGRPVHSGCATAGRHRAEPCQAGPSPPAPFPAPLRQHRVPTGSPQLPPGSPRRGRPPADIAAAPPLPAPLRPGPAPPAMGRLSGAARPERGRDGDGDEAWAAERWPVMALGAPRACPGDTEMPRSRP